ncbi:MAG: SusC/RagA family TonB-linked outer membrane protein [Prevotellaceae bacterium]|jgi:TonB-linked SusC/RagA family outer membrane protein|nr:SusC/RagA family TonB-linked outer membrane protein [Prevotellaceae bacterium]
MELKKSKNGWRSLRTGTVLLAGVCLLAMLGVVPVNAQQQSKTVTGTVVDKQGEPLAGVTVSLQGTSVVTLTDVNGQYSIPVQSDNQTLRFSYIGYKPVTAGTAQSVIRITLEEDALLIDEVVVTAMGIKKERKALGYAVQDIKSEELLKNKTANPINSLSGKIAGVNVTQSSGAAGSGAQIILRGGTSLDESRDNQPLFVVDGMIYDNSTSVVGSSGFDGMTGTATTNSNRVMDINSEDIENMSILKGPAASALYGSRAANGVIIITTKKGSEGSISVDFSTKFSTAWANRLPEQQSTYGRGSYLTDGTLEQTKYVASSWGEKLSSSAKRYNNVEDFFQNSTIFDNTLSVSGGNKNGSFYFSASNFDQKGIVPNTGYVKNTFRFNGEQKYGKFTLNVGAAYSQANTEKTLTSAGLWGSGGTGAMNSVYRWARNEDMTKWLNADGTKYVFPQYLDADGKRDLNQYALGKFVENPYWLINKNEMTDQTNRFTGNATLDFKVFDWWNVTYRAGIDRYTTGNKNIIAPGGEFTKTDYTDGMLSENQLDFQYLSYNLMSNMDKTFGDFNVGLLLGLSEEETKTERNYRMAIHPKEADFPSFSVSTDENKKFSQSQTKTRMRSFYGEFRASYKNLVYLTVTGRSDKNSTLYSPVTGDANAAYFYPSVSGSFVFSELLPESLNDIISFGKVRASWAKVGKGTDPYATSTTLWPFTTFIGDLTGTANYWYRGNPYLKPEMTTSIELGLEMRFLNGRVGFDYTYYSNTSNDLILNPRTSQTTGYIFNYTNIGEVFNKGMELSITGQPLRTKDWTWNMALNIAGNRGTVGTIHPGLPILYVTSVQVGFAKAASYQNGVFMGISGSKWYRTEDGKPILRADGMPTYDTGTSTRDTYYIGNREPKFTGGFDNSIQYKGWNLSFLLEFRVGGNVYNGTELWLTENGMSKQTENRESLTVTGVVNTGTTAAPVYEDREFTFHADQMYTMTGGLQSGKYIIQQYWANEYLMESANFMTETNWLRLRSLSLSYSLPTELLAKIKFIKGCTISATGTNLFLLTNYKGLDPEAAAAGSGVGGSSSVGIEYCNVPATTGMSFGISLKF